MFNTCEHLLEVETRLEERLSCLAAFDPVSADLIRPLLDHPAPTPPATIEPVEEQIARGSAEQEGEADIAVLLGAGTAADLGAVFRRIPESCQALLLECDPAQMARLFLEWPAEEWIKNGRLTLALGREEETVENRFLSLLNLRQAPAVRMIEMAAADPGTARFYHDALMRAKKTVHLSVFNLGTLVHRGPLWQYNTIRNLPALISSPGIAALKGAFAGRPAIVAGAGPSLNETLNYLPELAGRFALISTGTALRPLRKAGIRPDLVMSVDASRLTGPQFETACGDLYLACSSLVYPPIVPKFKGIFSASMAANPISEWLNAFGASKGTLIAAGTVTTSAIDLAIHMGCNPVICAGADLSFGGDGTTHVNHSMYHGSKLDPKKLIRVPGNYQAEVLTSAQFQCYIDLLEDFIRSHPETRFVNATDRGARIEGMELIPPGRLAEMAGEPLDAYGGIARLHQGFDESAREPIRHELNRIVTELQGIMNDARQAAMLCNQLIMMLQMPHKGDDLVAGEYLKTLRELDRRMTGQQSCSRFLDMSLWPIGYKTGTRREKHEEGYSDALLANKRSRALYEQIAGAATWTYQLLQEVTAQLENEKTPRTDPGKENEFQETHLKQNRGGSL